MLENIQYVIKKAQFITINQRFLDTFVSKISLSDIQKSLGKNDNAESGHYEEEINLLFLFSCINFAFWSLDAEEQLIEEARTKRKEKIIKAIRTLLLDHKPKLLGTLLNSISLDEFSKRFKNITPSFLNERWQNLREAGLILEYKYNNSYMNVLMDAGFDAEKALSLTVKYFPSFDDRSIYKGREIEFHKRAQVLLGFISRIPDKLYKLTNIDKLIGGADYRIPQLLRHLKIIQYSKLLKDKIDKNALIESGSEEEIEIRAFTLWVIHLIKKMLYDKTRNTITAMDVDCYLWSLNHKYGDLKPHHRTISIYY